MLECIHTSSVLTYIQKFLQSLNYTKAGYIEVQ